jgi:hypothetical protein
MPYVVTLKTDGKHVLIGLTGKPMSIAGLLFFVFFRKRKRKPMSIVGFLAL